MLQITPHMRVLVAVEPADFRCGIDGLARVCRQALSTDPFCGAVFVFRNRRGTGVKVLVYDGQGFWLAYKRFSSGHLRYWPAGEQGRVSELEAHELAVLFRGGDPGATGAAPVWREVARAG